VTPAYRRYALILLMVVYAFNMLDRQIVTILAEPMRRDLHLADWQLGAVTGLSFAVFYTVLGIPISRLADRGDRSRLIAASLATWSAFTFACGLCVSFPQILLARLGVGFGEAGCSPPAYSLITEYTDRARRASALAFYSLGIPLGALVGLAMGGLAADRLGWRAAFMIAGAPGVVLSLMVLITLREPRRAVLRAVRSAQVVPLGEALHELRSKASFWWVSVAAGLAAFVYYGQAAFYGSLFMRAYGAQIGALAKPFGLGVAGFLGIALGVVIGLASGLGTFFGGRLADRFAGADIAGYPRLCAIALTVAAPAFAAVPLSGRFGLSLTFLALAIFVHALCYGSTFAVIQSLVRPGNRAMASAIMLFFTNLIGLGLGPLTVGFLSDLLKPLVGAVLSLRFSMSLVCVMTLVAAACFVMAQRTVRREEHQCARGPGPARRAGGASPNSCM
jgi:MFS family permease